MDWKEFSPLSFYRNGVKVMNKKWVLISLLSIGIIVIVIVLIGLNNDRNQDSSGDRSQIITPNSAIDVGGNSEDMTEIPETLVEIAKIVESKAASIKTIELDGVGHMVSLNGASISYSWDSIPSAI